MQHTDVATRSLQSERLFQEARKRLQANRESDAIDLLRDALRLEPENPAYLSLYGLCLAKAGVGVQQALDACRRALRHAPGDVELQMNLGRVYRIMGDNAAAHRMFLRAWRQNRRHPGPASELARMGVRKPPIIRFLARSHWCNRYLGKLRERVRRSLAGRRGAHGLA
ncbi:MAG: hypothetical protein ACE5G2_03730 [Candidatus Krumholzibacteriia bacterium]